MSLNLEQMKLSGFEPNPDLKWEKIGDVPPPDGVDANVYKRAFLPALVSIDEHRVLVIDQVVGSISESFVRLFDTRTREWSNEEWPSLNQPRDDFGCVVCNGKVYVIGGMNTEGEYLDSIECLDLSATPRQWITSDQTLATARCDCKCVAIGTQVFILGGDGEEGGNLMSVEILNTDTGQIVPGPDMPQYGSIAAAAVNNKLLVFSKRREQRYCEIHTLRQGQPNSTWETTSFSLRNKYLLVDSIVFGDCVALSSSPEICSVYDTKRDSWWDLPPLPFTAGYIWTLVNDTELIAFSENDIYSLKLTRSVEPRTATIPRHTKSVFESMLYSPDFSDVLFVCPDGMEVPAHRNILATKNSYFRAYFGGPWTEEHPDGRWETEKSSDVIKALLSLMYTGEVAGSVTDSTLLDLLEAVYEFQLDDDLVRVCQAKCIENLSLSNVKDFLLSAKMHGASFLFDACFKFVCKHFSDLGSDPSFAGEIIKLDGQLWRDIFQSSSPSRKRKRNGNVSSNDD